MNDDDMARKQAQMRQIQSEIKLGEAARTYTPAAYIELKLTRHLTVVDVNSAVYSVDDWEALCDAERLPVLDRASGWTDVVAGGGVIDGVDEEPVVFRFCPDRIAATTDDLPVLADEGCVSLYIDLVEHIVDKETELWESEPDAVKRREAAEDAVYHLMDREIELDPDAEPVFENGPMMLLSHVQTRALELQT